MEATLPRFEIKGIQGLEEAYAQVEKLTEDQKELFGSMGDYCRLMRFKNGELDLELLHLLDLSLYFHRAILRQLGIPAPDFELKLYTSAYTGQTITKS